MASARQSSVLRIDVAESYEEMSRRAENLIVRELKRKPDLILCASAGGSPTLLYQMLADRHRRDLTLFRRMRVVQIDEWGGLDRGHKANCETDLRIKLLEPLNIDKKRYVGFRTESEHPKRECTRMAGWLSENGPIDICILGLGLNGHIAMNEPAETLDSSVHVARLARSSLNHGMLKELRKKPRYGLTIGMGDILTSRIVLLLVNGRHKRAALKRLLEPVVTTQFPASFLWLHAGAVVLCDREARGGNNQRR